MKYSILRTGQFKRDYKLAKKRGMKLALLLTVVEVLADGMVLDEKYKVHNDPINLDDKSAKIS